MSTIRKSMFTFTVLHRGDEPLTDLAAALEEATTGHAVGVEQLISTIDIHNDQVADELRAMRNDGSFFDDDILDAQETADGNR